MTQLSRHGALLVVLLITELLYLPSLYADFVTLDDAAYVTDNADVRQPALATIVDVQHTTLRDWTPAVTLTHALEYKFFGLRPVGYHLTNLLLHILSVILVYGVLRNCGVPDAECVAAALVFACHPLQVESVAWISARKNLLAAVFGLAFLQCVLKGRPLLAMGCLLLALASKGTAVVFPCWAVVATVLGFGQWSRRRAAPWLMVFLVTAVARGIASVLLQGPGIATMAPGEMSLSQRMAVMGPVFATQLRQFFLPYGLSLAYDTVPPSWIDPRVLGSWGLIAAVTVLVIGWARRDRQVALAACCTGIAILPTAQFVPGPYFQADRYTHLVLVGGALLGVKLIRCLERVRWWLPGAVLLLWCAFVLLPLARVRIGIWQNGKTLGEDTAHRAPHTALGWELVANYYGSRGQTEQAEAALLRAYEVEPDSADVRFKLALVSFNQGRLQEAETHAQAFLRLDRTGRFNGYYLLGRILLAQQRPEESVRYFNAALEMMPQLGQARYGRALAYLRLGQLDAAAGELQAMREPGHDDASILAMLATIRLRQGQLDEATALASRATQADPQAGVAWDAMGQTLLASGDVDGAETALQTGIALMPELADLRYHLAQVHERRGDHDGARVAAAAALRLVGSAWADWIADARRLAE